MSVSAVDFATGFRTMINKPIMAINPDKSIKMQKNRLAQHEKSIRADQQRQIYEIAKENGFNDADIKIGLEILKKVNLAYKESHNTPNPEAIHDKEISPENFIALKTTLSQKNIDINNISLINSATPSPCGSDADNRHRYGYSYTIEDGSISSASYSNIEPIAITFYPKFHLHNKNTRLSSCIHEATHVIEGHNIIHSMIPGLIGKITQKDPNEVKKSESFQRLVQINERQAEVLPSLKDKRTASSMREMRFEGHYPGMLYGQHYLQLSDIDETHKMIDYLEHVKTHPMPPIKEIRLKYFEQNNA